MDPHFDDLAKRTDKIKGYTEKFVKDSEAVLVPNPGTYVLVLYYVLLYNTTSTLILTQVNRSPKKNPIGIGR